MYRNVKKPESNSKPFGKSPVGRALYRGPNQSHTKEAHQAAALHGLSMGCLVWDTHVPEVQHIIIMNRQNRAALKQREKSKSGKMLNNWPCFHTAAKLGDFRSRKFLVSLDHLHAKSHFRSF